MNPLDFDYVFVRDQGVGSLMPFVEWLSTETLVIAALTWRWSSVNDEQRTLMRAELVRRGFSESVIHRAMEDGEARAARGRRDYEESVARFTGSAYRRPDYTWLAKLMGKVLPKDAP